MADFLFSAEGEARGFRIANLIYAMDGTAIGQVFAERAYRLDGAYVGSLYRNMVVDRPEEDATDRPAIRKPSAFPNPPKCRFRNKAFGIAFADVFDRLLISPLRHRAAPPTNVRRVWDDEDDFFRFGAAG